MLPPPLLKLFLALRALIAIFTPFDRIVERFIIDQLLAA
jgi:hypothetical protein